VPILKQVDRDVRARRIPGKELSREPEQASTDEGRHGRPFTMRALGTAGLAVVFAVSFLMPPSGLGVSTCAFRNTIGIPCPGCGLTRSFAAISHGQPGNAFRAHPLGIAVYAGMAIYMVKWAVEALLRRRLLARLEDRAVTPVLWALVFSMVSVWLFRLAAGWLC
jgi:hypothetical protein